MRRLRNMMTSLGLLAMSLLLSAASAQAQSTWTGTNHMNAARSGQTATVLRSGQVLVAGGENSIGNVQTTELYNPSTGSWTLTGNSVVARATAAAALLSNGNVLVAGGCNTDCIGALSSSEIYNPITRRWTLIARMATPRFSFTATVLISGKVLVAGGCTATNLHERHEQGRAV